jgi:hypothetical protein
MEKRLWTSTRTRSRDRKYQMEKRMGLADMITSKNGGIVTI